MKTKLSIFQWLFMGYLICFITSISNAATVTVDKDNIRYMVDDVAMTAEVYGPVSSSTIITNLVIPDYIEYSGQQVPVISIRSRAFDSNKNLRGSLTIGDNVQTIGDYAFYSCSGFTGSLTIGYNVQTIGNNAFYSCSGFTGSLTIGYNVQTIGSYAFFKCSGFTASLTIGDNVQSIGNYAFSSCSGFTGSLTIGDNVQTIGNYAFFNCSGFTGSLTIGDNVQIIGEMAFFMCSGFTGSLTIGDNVQTIGNDAFNFCSGFTGLLTIGNLVQTIEDRAFYHCSGFTGSLTIGDNVQTIGSDTFGDCSGFTGELVIPKSVKEIGSSCFAGCDNIKSLIISSSNTIINYQAFYCSGLESITSLGTTPPKCVYGMSGSYYYDSVFAYSYNKPLYVPSESVILYKNATEWKKFKHINPISVEATAISLNKNELNLLIGQEETLIATLQPEDATTEVVWSTENNDNVISVDQTGKVSALSVGTATVVAKAGEVSATCQVTVKPVLATNIIIDGDGINTLKETESLQLTASILPDNVTYDEVTWRSSDENKAEVSQNGLVTALEAGQVEIIAELKYQPEIKTAYQLTIEPRILGDANDNGVVNVADVGTISDYIVNKQVFKFCFVNADVITDQRITTADVTATVDIIFNEDPPLMKLARARKITATNDNRLVVDDFKSNSTSNFGIRLTDPSDFVGLQASVILPQGMVVRNVISGESSKNHILNYNITDHGTLDFILYSLTNDSFSNAGSLLEIEAVCENSCEDINVENILASDGSANEYTLTFSGGKNNGLETSLEGIEQNDIFINVLPAGIMILNAKGENVNIFNLTGEVISSNEIPSDKEFYSLASGIYIVNVKDVTTKIIVK